MELVFFWILCAVAAGMIGSRKDQGGTGFLLGFLFGPFGILFALLLTGNRVACPYCKEKIHPEAIVCPHCRKDQPAKVESQAAEEQASRSFWWPSKGEAAARARAERIVERAKGRDGLFGGY